MSRPVFALVCACLLAGCESRPIKDPAPNTRQPAATSEISGLLSARQRFCALPELEQAAQILARRGSAAERDQFELLLLASCNPARTPGLLRNTLKNLINHAQWTAEKQALFDLILAQSRAYDIVEGKYRDLELEYQKLQRELDDTIKGIQQIESDMDTSHESDANDNG